MSKRVYTLLVPVLMMSPPLFGGILITRTDKGIQFVDAAVVSVNAKDKVLGLGAQTKVVPKPPQVKLGGTLLKDADSGVFGLYDAEAGTLNFVLPDGIKNPSGDAAPYWKTAKISYKKTEKDKTGADISTGEFLAFVPGSLEALAHLCQSPRATQILGGKGKAFEFELTLIGATVKAYGTNPPIAPLAGYVEAAMRQSYEQFNTGTAGVEVLERGLKYAELSAAVYPNVPEQQKLRDQLKQQRNWLDTKIAVLKALAAGKEWDAFIVGDRDFEKYRQAFPEMAKKHILALNESISMHKQAGDSRLKEKEYHAALREYRLALARKPADAALGKNADLAWNEYSRQEAENKKNERPQLTPGQVDAINNALYKAGRYKDQKQLNEALESVGEAEAVSPVHLKVLLAKAQILLARRDMAKAQQALDEYDRRAVDEERKEAAAVRNELTFEVENGVRNAKPALERAWAESNFNRGRQLAHDALRLKDNDPDLLRWAGNFALAVRQPKEAKAYFEQYLNVSDTLDANDEQRLAIRRLMTSISDVQRPEQGVPNWLSGKRLAEGVYYDPISLAFQPKIANIDASNKLKVSFEWDGEKLRSITPSFDKNEHVTGEKRITFAYDEKVPQVAAVDVTSEARIPVTADPDEAFKRSSLVLLNNPYVDPIAVQKLTGRNVTLGIAGNKFFLPYVWDGIHFFRFSYDSAGRVSQALEIGDPRTSSGDSLVEFQWDGMLLKTISAYSVAGGRRGAKYYERTLNYRSGQLVEEDIQSQGKSSKIVYKYLGNKLATAKCDKDLTLDGRERQVTFR